MSIDFRIWSYNNILGGCDVNRIMQDGETETGRETNVQPQFGDFSAEFDFRNAQDALIRQERLSWLCLRGFVGVSIMTRRN